MKPVRLAGEARAELFEAADWYDRQRPGLGARFLDDAEWIFSEIAVRPRSFPRVRDVQDDLDVRRALFGQFPYAAVFIELNEEFRVLAVAHLRRRPGYWLYRLSPR